MRIHTEVKSIGFNGTLVLVETEGVMWMLQRHEKEGEVFYVVPEPERFDSDTVALLTNRTSKPMVWATCVPEYLRVQPVYYMGDENWKHAAELICLSLADEQTTS